MRTRWVRLCLWVGAIAAVVAGWGGAGAQMPTGRPTPAAAPQGVPAGRAAKNVAIITIRGEIDKWTAFGVERRLDAAVKGGADAIVFDIDTPGGELGAVLKICNAIKASPVTNTVAWVNPNAYSGGAIIALACREIVVSDPATLGDALPIVADPIRGVQALPDAEREKFLGPLISEVVDSARRNEHDEMLVQGIVRRGVELWLVEHVETGARLFVTEAQYRAAVGEEPGRTLPELVSATGSVGGEGDQPRVRDAEEASVVDDTLGRAGSMGGVGAGQETVYLPAAPGTSEALKREVDANLEIAGSRSRRPDLLSPAHRGKYKPIEYVSDGKGLVVLKASQMVRYGVAQQVVKNDEELKAYFGAQSVARLNETWSERLVRFLTNPFVRGVLIVTFLLALFIEMTQPGVVLPGAIAGVALVALVVPPVLVDLAAWWGVAAVLVGIGLIVVEVLLIPGFGFAGVAGIILLFGGLVGIFVGGPAGLFPGTRHGMSELAFGTVTVFISTVTAIVLMYFIGRHIQSLPMLNRLVLSGGAADEGPSEGLLSAMAPGEAVLKTGDEGVAITPLRPAGRVEIGGNIVDVVVEGGFIGAGERVRVAAVEQFRTVVERA